MAWKEGREKIGGAGQGHRYPNRLLDLYGGERLNHHCSGASKMQSSLIFVALALGAPGLKERPKICPYRVVYAECVSTRVRDEEVGAPPSELPRYLESTFVITEPGSVVDTKETRFTVRYLNGDFPGWRYSGSRFKLREFATGDRSYWIIAQGPKGENVAVEWGSVLSADVLPDPYALIHHLSEKAVEANGQIVPAEAATRELAGAVARGLRLKTAKERTEFIRQESDTKNKFVKQYLEWLEKKGKE